MAEVKFLQLSPGWQKMHLKMHQIDVLKYGIFLIFMPPDNIILTLFTHDQFSCLLTCEHPQRAIHCSNI